MRGKCFIHRQVATLASAAEHPESVIESAQKRYCVAYRSSGICSWLDQHQLVARQMLVKFDVADVSRHRLGRNSGPLMSHRPLGASIRNRCHRSGRCNSSLFAWKWAIAWATSRRFTGKSNVRRLGNHFRRLTGFSGTKSSASLIHFQKPFIGRVTSNTCNSIKVEQDTANQGRSPLRAHFSCVAFINKLFRLEVARGSVRQWPGDQDAES